MKYLPGVQPTAWTDKPFLLNPPPELSQLLGCCDSRQTPSKDLLIEPEAHTSTKPKTRAVFSDFEAICERETFNDQGPESQNEGLELHDRASSPIFVSQAILALPVTVLQMKDESVLPATRLFEMMSSLLAHPSHQVSNDFEVKNSISTQDSCDEQPKLICRKELKKPSVAPLRVELNFQCDSRQGASRKEKPAEGQLEQKEVKPGQSNETKNFNFELDYRKVASQLNFDIKPAIRSTVEPTGIEHLKPRFLDQKGVRRMLEYPNVRHVDEVFPWDRQASNSRSPEGVESEYKIESVSPEHSRNAVEYQALKEYLKQKKPRDGDHAQEKEAETVPKGADSLKMYVDNIGGLTFRRKRELSGNEGNEKGVSSDGSRRPVNFNGQVSRLQSKEAMKDERKVCSKQSILSEARSLRRSKRGETSLGREIFDFSCDRSMKNSVEKPVKKKGLLDDDFRGIYKQIRQDFDRNVTRSKEKDSRVYTKADRSYKVPKPEFLKSIPSEMGKQSVVRYETVNLKHSRSETNKLGGYQSYVSTITPKTNMRPTTMPNTRKSASWKSRERRNENTVTGVVPRLERGEKFKENVKSAIGISSSSQERTRLGFGTSRDNSSNAGKYFHTRNLANSCVQSKTSLTKAKQKIQKKIMHIFDSSVNVQHLQKNRVMASNTDRQKRWEESR